MPATALTPLTPVGPYPQSVSAAALDLAFTAADNVNGNKFSASGRDLLLIWNTDASPHTVTLTSQYDATNRKADVTAYSVAATTISAFLFSALPGWVDGSNQINLSANSALIKFAVVRVGG